MTVLPTRDAPPSAPLCGKDGEGSSGGLPACGQEAEDARMTGMSSRVPRTGQALGKHIDYFMDTSSRYE